MSSSRLVRQTILVAQCAFALGTSAHTATEQAPDIQSLQRKIANLDQEFRALEQTREPDRRPLVQDSKSAPKISLGKDGFSLSSADTNFGFGFHGTIQLDSRSFCAGQNPNNSGFLLRRARPIFTGTVFHDFDFNITPDFGGSSPLIYDAYVNCRYREALQLEAGKFKAPVGLEALQSDNWLSFNERSLATDLMPNRGIGVELHGDLTGGTVTYAAAILHGAPDYATPTANRSSDNNIAFAGRVFFLPWKKLRFGALEGLGFGAGGSYGTDDNSSEALTPGFTTDAQQKFFTYASGVVANRAHWRLSPQGYYYAGPFSLLAEYVMSAQAVSRTTAPLGSADLRNAAGEVTAGWVLTGESESYSGLTPRHSFDPLKGDWGAWQIVGRYAELNVDDKAFSPALPFALSTASARSARAWAVGVNWYLNRDVRVNASFSRTEFSGYSGAANAVPAQAEVVVFTRVQLAF